MEFPDQTATRLTELILEAIRPHLRESTATVHHYNRAYEKVARVLANAADLTPDRQLPSWWPKTNPSSKEPL